MNKGPVIAVVVPIGLKKELEKEAKAKNYTGVSELVRELLRNRVK